ncbi:MULTISPECIES: hypothetical protein [Trichococcus]
MLGSTLGSMLGSTLGSMLGSTLGSMLGSYIHGLEHILSSTSPLSIK